VFCENGAIVLSGRLPSFYLKQIAQTIAASVDGVRRLENRVEVVRALAVMA
jgi:osmotically-inducible protein OsmY